MPASPSSVMRPLLHSRFVGGEQADGGDIGRQIERVGGERALQGLAPSAANVSTPSALLPSSSTLTLDRPMVPPTTLVCALIAKRPKPPPGSGCCPVQISVSRSEAASAASVPSILRVGLTLIAPSNAAFHRRPADAQFQSAAAARKRRRKIGERQARVHRLRHAK